MTSSPPTRWQPGRRPVLVPDLGAQLLAALVVLEELLTDLAVWEDEDATDPFRARQALWLPAPLAGWRWQRCGGCGPSSRPASSSAPTAVGYLSPRATQGRGKVRIVGLTCGDPDRRPRPASAASSAAWTCSSV